MQEIIKALATRQSIDPKVATIEGRNAVNPVLLGHPEQGRVRQIRGDQMADL
jgi:hypothetical protein